jgi:hypothetical protein
VRRTILREVLAATARAFDREPPATTPRSVRTLSHVCIERSDAWAREALARGEDLSRIRARLFAEARSLGARARRELRVRDEAQGAAAARLLYRAIGVDLRADREGVRVSRCAYASAYSPQVCRLMSAMDSGLIAGLTGAAGLVFTARITEGAPACRAVILHGASR